MRNSSPLRLLLVGLLASAALVTAGRAQADEEFDVSVKPGRVVVTAKGKWHINKEYPWKLTMGETKIAKFELSEHSATVEAPKGAGKLKGGVCNGDQCRMFQVSVDVP
jgi:hypothetical protein